MTYCYLSMSCSCIAVLFFFNATATTEIYTLSLHDALPIWSRLPRAGAGQRCPDRASLGRPRGARALRSRRSEEHTSELQSHSDLVCRLLLEKKKAHSSKRRIAEHQAD